MRWGTLGTHWVHSSRTRRWLMAWSGHQSQGCKPAVDFPPVLPLVIWVALAGSPRQDLGFRTWQLSATIWLPFPADSACASHRASFTDQKNFRAKFYSIYWIYLNSTADLSPKMRKRKMNNIVCAINDHPNDWWRDCVCFSVSEVTSNIACDADQKLCLSSTIFE